MKRIVVKVGSAVLTQDGQLARERIASVVSFLCDLKKRYDLILVSSGAVSAGYTQLQLDKTILQNKQALAAIGQPLLMRQYRKEFAKYDERPAQILLTAANLQVPSQNKKIKNTIDVLLENKIIPIINENDATAVEELVVGDNDQLSAYVACSLDAEVLIILSDIDAFYDKDPHKYADAKVQKIVHSISKMALNEPVSPHNEFATGGIVTKLKAAAYMLKHKRKMFLTSGFDLRDAIDFFIHDTHNGGTLFMDETR